MISRERLEELIDQKATIWADDYGAIQLCDKSEVCRVISFEGESYCLFGFIYDQRFINDNIFPEELEEDVEKGEWEYEMHDSRLERFEPPVWEDFLEKEEYIFWSKNHRQTIIRVLGIKYIVVETSFERFYTGDSTKENYIKACTIARKLFLGETIEEENENEESKN